MNYDLHVQCLLYDAELAFHRGLLDPKILQAEYDDLLPEQVQLLIIQQQQKAATCSNSKT